MRLTPEGWVYLVVLAFITVGSVLRNVNLLIVMAGMMYAPLLLNWRVGIRWLKSFRASRRLPKRLHANELASIQWTCENRFFGMAGWNVVINDRVTRVRAEDPDAEIDESKLSSRTSGSQQVPASGAESEGQNWFRRSFGEVFSRFAKPIPGNRSEVKISFVRVQAGQSEVASYRAFFAQRGQYEIGPAALSTTFPFGLIVSRIHYPKPKTVFVAPEIGSLHPTWERQVQSIVIGSDTVKRQRSLEEDEFYALRPWRSGDSKKNIHWRTSARYGQPIVKQHDQQNNRDFALVLDLVGSASSAQLAVRCERALSFTATAILQIGNAVQGQVAVGVCGRESGFCHSRTQHGSIHDVMQLLAVAQFSDDPKTVEMLFRVAESVSKGTPIYVVSSRARPAELDPTQIDTQTGDGLADRRANLLRSLLPLVRWIEVGSLEFESMFSMKQDGEGARDLAEFSEKWIKC
ncbi:MAG: hypothetical protein ACI87E_003343 [Mariniblastus sp.]|jgi:hypothetical protein